MKIVPYQDIYQETWDRFILEESWNGTFLHTRRFLSYHNEQFKDMSLIVQNDRGKIIAVFPSAEQPGDRYSVMSHPGITYGGLVAGPDLRGEDCVDSLANVGRYYRDLGYKRLYYKAVPHIYHVQPYQDDLYALFRLGGKHYRDDISCCIDLDNRGEISKGHKWSANKAIKNGINIFTGSMYASFIMELVSQRLLAKYAAMPVHTTAEILLLHNRFPENILFAVASCGSEVVAGTVIFVTKNVFHTQYLAASDKGQNMSAMNLLLESCIIMAKDQNKRYFDFGTSNEKEGSYLNQGLFLFKTRFGSGSVVHEDYDLDLRNLE